MNKKRLIGYALVMLSVTSIHAQETNTSTQEYKLWYNRPAQVWTEALPLGNGRLGAMVYGTPGTEQIQLNEETIWAGRPNNNANPDALEYIPKVRELVFAGKYLEAQTLATEKVMAKTNSGMPYQSFGDLRIAFPGHTRYSDYYRELSLDSARAIVRYEVDGVQYQRETITSFTDQVVMVRLTASRPGQITFNAQLTSPHQDVMISSEEGNCVTLSGVSSWHEGLKGKVEFQGRLTARNRGGKIACADGILSVEGADEAIIYVSIATNFNNYLDITGNQIERAKDYLSKAMKHPFPEAKKNHTDFYRRYLTRVSLNLGKNRYENITTDKRVENFKDTNDAHLVATYFQFGRYLLICSSQPGGQPANLQGIWHNDVDGPWRVDYHNNINVQMNYWPACSTNLNECVLPLVDFIRTLVKPGERTAQSYFGARGWTASISANIFGFTAPLESQDMSWNFNPMAGPWLATHIWEYYDYTRDLKFLKETGYELIKSSANFAVDYLWHKPDGTYTAAPSTSPEHGPIDQGATFVHAVVREILLDAIKASEELGVDKKERKEWEQVLANLVPYKIGRYGQLMEWSVDIDDPKDEHRHVNHLFGLHPGHTVSPVTTPELAEAAKVVLVHRGDGATGWSMGWKLNQWARLQDGNHAYTLFANLLKNGTLDNLWDTHPPFQIDGNFGGTAGITEMLLQSHMGFIQLLPALPDAWKEGSVRGICAKGNFEVDMIWENGLLKEATILSKSGERCIVKYAGKTLSFKTVKGHSYQLKYDSVKGELLKR